MNRRKFLLVAGGGMILSASAASGAFVATRSPEAALEPWRAAGLQYDGPRRKALSYAILAPSPHNRQPWLVNLDTEGEVVLSADTGRLLPQTDPFSRQVTIGLGCFLELLAMAAAEDSYRVELLLFPEGQSVDGLDARPVARARFVPDPALRSDPLFRHVLERRSLKEPYDLQRAVATASLETLLAAAIHGSRAGTTNGPETMAALRDLTRRALEIEIDTPRTLRESVDLFRLGKSEIENNTREDQINAGRDWLRVNLAATAAGLGIHPLSQALQEFPEMAGLYTEVHQSLAPNGGTVQMLARLGHAAATASPSPRWPLEAKIV